jgi:anti-sigma B factor antagonist
MKTLTHKEDNCLIITIEGDLDASSCLVLDKSIATAIEQGESKILIDCQLLNYISSAGLGVFMSYLEEFEEKNISMVIFGLSEKVFNVFKILGLNDILKITPNKSEAMALMSLKN